MQKNLLYALSGVALLSHALLCAQPHLKVSYLPDAHATNRNMGAMGLTVWVPLDGAPHHMYMTQLSAGKSRVMDLLEEPENRDEPTIYMIEFARGSRRSLRTSYMLVFDGNHVHFTDMPGQHALKPHVDEWIAYDNDTELVIEVDTMLRPHLVGSTGQAPNN